uniref:Uncharacterized protein n=1 Tax=Anguilla anguilla TaxID=7936 RepID=A0A0E9PHI5_ANGAN
MVRVWSYSVAGAHQLVILWSCRKSTV